MILMLAHVLLIHSRQLSFQLSENLISSVIVSKGDSKFRNLNFQPKIWEVLGEEQEEVSHCANSRNIISLAEGWTDWKEEPIRSQMVNGDEVEVGRRRQVIIETGRIVHGFER